MAHKSLNIGVIEGFYGLPWDPAARLQMLGWLGELGIDAYLYAPKSDSCLRKEWRRDWDSDQRAYLRQLSKRCASSGLKFHVGLSPFALYLNYDRPARRALRDKLRHIVDLEVDGLAILFDDMPGQLRSLASRQAEICADVEDCIGDLQLHVCPTYYSDDTVLDRVFGERPVGYLETLGRELSPAIDVFWTGPEVCSRVVSQEALTAPSHALRRRLSLWDNYPVNDSKTRSDHLYVQPLSGRDPALGVNLAGHWCNAMNQPALSLPALASLPRLYGRHPADADQIMAQAGITTELLKELEPLASRSLNDLEDQHRRRLQALSRRDSLAALELRAWLSGDYTFDPACLTD